MSNKNWKKGSDLPQIQLQPAFKSIALLISMLHGNAVRFWNMSRELGIAALLSAKQSFLHPAGIVVVSRRHTLKYERDWSKKRYEQRKKIDQA